MATAKTGLFGRLARAISAIVARAHQAFGGDHYRPEQHYMRGPGPKTQAKAARGKGAGA